MRRTGFGLQTSISPGFNHLHKYSAHLSEVLCKTIFDFPPGFLLLSARVIDTQEKLAAFLPLVRAADWIAVDTEADSLHAYPEKVCLIQITTTEGDSLVDPLADLDLPALLAALAGHQLIMHGADYDLRLLHKHHGFTPSAIFDHLR